MNIMFNFRTTMFFQMPHNTSEYNFAYNEGGLIKYVWNNMFSNSQNGTYSYKNGSDARYQGQQHQFQRANGIGSTARNNQGMDCNQLQRGKG